MSLLSGIRVTHALSLADEVMKEEGRYRIPNLKEFKADCPEIEQPEETLAAAAFDVANEVYKDIKFVLIGEDKMVFISVVSERLYAKADPGGACG